MASKPKKNQPQTPNEVQLRDCMWTPNYGVDILLPFIPKHVHRILEPAAGSGKIVKYLQSKGYDVVGRDINPEYGYEVKNFLDDIDANDVSKFDMIVTNPAFSLKGLFYKQCRKYNLPFSLLIPLDYSLWVCNAISKDNIQKIIPDSRINYVTPNIVANIYKGESKQLIERNERLKFKNWFEIPDDLKLKYLDRCEQFRYNSVEECPNELLAKHSASQFHSGWFTWGLNLGQSETFVHLTKEMKLNI